MRRMILAAVLLYGYLAWTIFNLGVAYAAPLTQDQASDTKHRSIRAGFVSSSRGARFRLSPEPVFRRDISGTPEVRSENFKFLDQEVIFWIWYSARP